MRCATVYRKAGQFFIHAHCQATSGIWIASEPFIALPANVDSTEVARAIWRSLAASRVGIEHPSDWEKVDYPLPRLAGAKSWAEFMKTAQGVGITELDNTLQLTPYENRGPREGYVAIEPPIGLPCDVDDVTLAKGIDEAFSRCR